MGYFGIKTIVNTKFLTSECWMIQFMGLEACETCEDKDSNACGGKRVRKTGKNSKGYLISLGAVEKNITNGWFVL